MLNFLFKKRISVAVALAATGLALGAAHAETAYWDYAGKTGIGTAYAPYGQSRAASRVWYSSAEGYLTETAYGMIHEAQVASARIAVVSGGKTLLEGRDTDWKAAFADTDAKGRPLSPALKLVTRAKDGSVEIEKVIFTDPRRNALFMHVVVRPLRGAATPYLVVEPHVGNTAAANLAEASRTALVAHQGATFVAIVSASPFAAASADPLGQTDGLHRLDRQGDLGAGSRTSGAPGPTLLTAQLSAPLKGARSFDIVIGFGGSAHESERAARGALKTGYAPLLSRFEGKGGEKDGWRAWLRSLSELDRVASAGNDGGRLAYASALVLKSSEDKLYPGALIASFSNPWGDTVPAVMPSTGYKAVWPRDFYQCAMALAAIGDRETPVMALKYLKKVQVRADTPGASGATGWFQQKSQVDGKAEWFAVQLDQTAMPIMLAWKLETLGLVPKAELQREWSETLKPAADFLVKGGEVALGTNRAVIHPPYTQQERWEEKEGYSPSTTAAEIAGLTLAADMARRMGDLADADRYQAAADDYSAHAEARMAVDKGALANHPYYLRISTAETAAASPQIGRHNGQSAIAADKMVDAGFLELVRYGVRRADDPLVTESLKVIDDQSLPDDLRVRYDIRFPGDPTAYPAFRRYGHDGYGEDLVTGADYGGQTNANQRGRLWPIFTGERGHYEIARVSAKGPASAADLAAIRKVYAGGMERFANQGLMIPEQVYDGVGTALPHHPAPGEGTGSATPLSWAHAEYLKLLRSLADGRVFDRYEPVAARYAR